MPQPLAAQRQPLLQRPAAEGFPQGFPSPGLPGFARNLAMHSIAKTGILDGHVRIQPQVVVKPDKIRSGFRQGNVRLADIFLHAEDREPQ